jgi:hypothetical protein
MLYYSYQFTTREGYLNVKGKNRLLVPLRLRQPDGKVAERAGKPDRLIEPADQAGSQQVWHWRSANTADGVGHEA